MRFQWIRRCLGVAMVVASVLAVAATAQAMWPGARFVFEQCDSALPGGAVPVSEHGFNPVFAPYENCGAPGGSIGLLDTQPISEQPGVLWVGVPATPMGFVESMTITAVESGIESDGLGYSHVMENGFPGPVPEATRIFPVHSEPVAELFGNTGGTGIGIYMTCGVQGVTCQPGPTIGVHYIAATEVDPHPPTVGPVSGTATSSGVLRGHQTLAGEASDVGGGLTSLSVLVNGIAVPPAVVGACAVAQVSNRSTYGTVTWTPSPCPSRLSGAWTLDTSAYPFHDGANTIAVCASDFATLGNPNTTCSPARTVTVDNSCTESSVAGGDELSAQFTQSNAETVTVGYGSGAEVSGTLRDDAGDPISGATLCLKSQTLGIDPAPAPVGTVKTDAEGRFAYAVPAGPNRELMVGYRHDSFQLARSVRYYAHTAPTLVANPPKLANGGRVKLWGLLPQPGAEGRVVVLQANVVGSKRWITFRRATTDAHGHFQAGYRFHSTTRKTTYRFRAIVPRQDHYPYEEGHSEPVSVLVHPHHGHHHRRSHR